MNSVWIVTFLCMLWSSLAQAELSGKEIMLKNEEARKVEDVLAKARIEIGGADAEVRVKEFEWWKKLTPDQIHYNTLTRFNIPAEVRGQGILFLEHDDDINEILMYLPSFKKIRRVESQRQSQSFMGSELSYSDMATPHTLEYEHQLLKEEDCGGENAQLKCYVIESTPVSEDIRDRTGYSKFISRVRSDQFMVVGIEYWDLKRKLLKRAEMSEVTLVDSVKKKWMSLRIRVENLQTKKYTLLHFSEVKANKGISDALFTQSNLSRVR